MSDSGGLLTAETKGIRRRRLRMAGRYLVAVCTPARRENRKAGRELGPAGDICYLTSSLFLREAYRDVVRDSAEEMHFVTGPETGGYRVLGQLVAFEKTAPTPGRVTGEPRSTHKALIALTRAGHRLLAWIHSHPGRGPDATLPSGTDLAHQARLERGGYPTIGVIASRDGYLRFFSTNLPFTLHITGSDI